MDNTIYDGFLMPPVARRPRGRCGSKRFHHGPGAVRTALPVQERGMDCRAGLAGPPFGDRIRLSRHAGLCRIMCSALCLAPSLQHTLSPSLLQSPPGAFPDLALPMTLAPSSRAPGACSWDTLTAKVMQALQRAFQTRHSFVMEQEHLPGCPHRESSRLGWGPQLPPAFPSAQSGFGTRYHQDPFPPPNTHSLSACLIRCSS